MSIRTRSERLAWLVVLCSLFAWARPARADELDAHRERFRVGYEKYMGRDFAGAIVEWEAIYRELGAERGYRLAFNLARAYDAYGDTDRAAESYERYLAEVARRADGPPLEAIVSRQAEEAVARLEELRKARGRLSVKSGARPVAVKIDAGEPRVSGFTAYVSPGAHTVTFEPGTADERKVELSVGAGALEIVEAPATKSAPEVVAPTGPGLEAAKVEPAPRSGPPASAPRSAERPFPAWVLYAGGAATAVSLVVPFVYYQHANDVYDRGERAKSDAEKQRIMTDEYPGAKTEAYVSWVVPCALAVATAGLATYYFFGSKETPVTVAPAAALGPRSGFAGLSGRF